MHIQQNKVLFSVLGTFFRLTKVALRIISRHYRKFWTEQIYNYYVQKSFSLLQWGGAI